MTAHIAEQEDGGVVYAPGTTLHYVREVLGLGGCSDPEDPAPNAMPCVLAPSIAVSGVGMPYMFPGDDGSVPFSDPWEYRPGIGADQPASARWWKQQLYVFVADRDAFVRPSFNPSMRRTTERTPHAERTTDLVAQEKRDGELPATEPQRTALRRLHQGHRELPWLHRQRRWQYADRVSRNAGFRRLAGAVEDQQLDSAQRRLGRPRLRGRLPLQWPRTHAQLERVRSECEGLRSG